MFITGPTKPSVELTWRSNALTGASLAFPSVMLVLRTTNSGIGSGVSSAISRALGAGRRDRADHLVANVALGGAVGICVINLLGNAVRGTGNMGLPRIRAGRLRVGAHRHIASGAKAS